MDNDSLARYSLPDELLEHVFRFCRTLPALPPPNEQSRIRSTWSLDPSSHFFLEMRFAPPSTFAALRLVCRRWRRIATPFMWETLDVQLQHSDYTIDPHAAKQCALRASRNSLQILEYVAARPAIAEHVRVLCLRVSGYSFAALTSGIGTDDLELRIERLLSQTSGLVAFCIDKGDLLTSAAVRHLLSYKRNLRLVDLRTVGFRGAGLQLLAESDLSVVDRLGLSMFNLAQRSLTIPRGLRRVLLHCDSMSTFIRDEEIVLEPCLGIDSIEELVLYDKHGDMAHYLSKGFSEQRISGRPAALKNLFIDAEFCRPSRLNETLYNFQSTNLEKLTVRNLRRLDPQHLTQIIGYFPNLRVLGLSSGPFDIVPAWITGCFFEYIKALRCATKLEVLEWDNVVFIGGDGKDDSQHNENQAGVKALSGVPSIRELRLLSFAECKMDVYSIRRDDKAYYAGYSVCREVVFPDFRACHDLIGNLYR